MILIIYNPVCGDRTAKSFLYGQVLPLLANHSLVYNIFATEYHGHAGKIVGNFLANQHQDDTQVILLSGDGTLHEIINCASLLSKKASHTNRVLNIVLVASGTANALYSSLFIPPSHLIPQKDDAYRLQSLHNFLSASRTKPLKISINTLSSSTTLPVEVLSAVVTSTCLHASILYDSEQIRQEHPGLDRFKVAAQKNASQWYSGHAKLFPLASNGTVQIFEPSLQKFIDHPDFVKGAIELQGPFVYFLSAINVDRLEPAYVIAPSTEPTQTEREGCDLIIIRPSRSPAYRASDTERYAFSPILWEILTAPYKNGVHIYLRYTTDGNITVEGQGPPVVEYIRCGGWEWCPDHSDPAAHIVCFDGAIHQIPMGGRLASCAAEERNGIKFAVYA